MITALLLTTLALAQPRPPAATPHPDECADVIPTPATVPCLAVALPLSVVADYEADRRWAFALRDELARERARARRDRTIRDVALVVAGAAVVALAGYQFGRDW